MAETFKAVDGFTTQHQIETLNNGDGDMACVGGESYKEQRGAHPCTIIPGHWAERIESGELLTLDEWTAIRDGVDLQPNPLHNAIVIAVCTQIARKLRGEA